MKKLLLVLAMILSVIVISACQTSEDPIVELENYDYYLLVVVGRQRQSQDTFVYVLKDTGTMDTITYESDELWSVGEFIIAIELDEEGNVYLTDLNTTYDYMKEETK